MLRLTTFVISHFSEKARWALDYEGIAYEERSLLPGPHLLVTRRLAQASTVPILEDGSRVIQGSSEILDYMGASLGATRLLPLYALAESRELEALADHALGLGVQRISYDVLLQQRSTMIDLWAQRGPAWAKPFYALTLPALVPAVRHLYGVRPDAVARAKQRFREAIGTFDQALSGRRYFGEGAPNRLDITVAALLGPFCRPPEHRVNWPLIPALSAFTAEFEGSRTFQHAREMYRMHRSAPKRP